MHGRPFYAACAKHLNEKKAVLLELPFFLGGVREQLLIFVSHLFSKFSVFMLGDFFSSLFDNATHSILPPYSDCVLVLNSIPSCQQKTHLDLQVYIIFIIGHCKTGFMGYLFAFIPFPLPVFLTYSDPCHHTIYGPPGQPVPQNSSLF